MSFYLGTGGSGKIMHITKGSYADTAMQGGILPDTVFHSDLGYITYELYDAANYSPYWLIPTAALTQIVNEKRLYFMIRYSAGIWYEWLQASSNAPSNIIWFTAPGGSMSYFPSMSYPYAYIGATTEALKVLVINIAESGYIPTPTSGNEVVLRAGDIIVKGVDLYDLKYINATPVNTSDIQFHCNSGAMQLVNSAYTPPNNMSLRSNSSFTEIATDGKVIFTTNVVRDKVFFKDIITASIPYGYVTTSGSGTWYATIFGAGTFSEGDMFLIKYYQDGQLGYDFSTSANAILRYVNGDIQVYNYSYISGAYHATSTYVGAADGSLTIRYNISIYASGTLRTKAYYFTAYRLK